MKQDSQKTEKNKWKISHNLQMWGEYIIGILFAIKVFCGDQEKF